MSLVANALIPVIALIMLGAFLRRVQFMDDSVWPNLEKLSYYILMPALLINLLSSKDLSVLAWGDIFIAVEVPILVAAFLFLLARPLLPFSAPQFTSMFQGGVRFNTFVAFALIQGLYGDQGLIVAALASGFMIVLINLLCVAMFSVVLNRDGPVIQTVVRQIIRNPLIIGCLVGYAINLSPIQLPTASQVFLEILGGICLPLALLSIGAGLKFRSLVQNRLLSLLVNLVQFAIKPAVAYGCCVFLGLNGYATAAIVLMMCMPTASSSYILARQLGGDHQLMAAIITQQTLLSFMTLPFVIWALSYLTP